MQKILPLHATRTPQQLKVATHCPYCALQCGMLVSGTREQVTLVGNEAFPVNKGGLCVKGWNAAGTLKSS